VGDWVGILQWLVIVTIVGLVGWFAWKRLIAPRVRAPRA
jgi:hypothetical protein